MIIINHEKCNLCGLCLRICHESCISIADRVLIIDYEYCSTCTQCIAICPLKALSWDHHEPLDFDKTLYPLSSQVAELLMERRTIRDFAKKPVARILLEEIANYAIYAPTHDFNLRVVIIDDEQIIDQIDNIIHRFSINLYNWIFKHKFIHTLIKTIAPQNESEYLRAIPKLENAIKRRKGFKSKPAAIIMIIGNRRIPLSLESAQYALYNIDLFAQSNGLACRNLVGNQMVLNRNKKFRRSVGINHHERISGVMAVGYPSVKFSNKVMGKKMSIQWN